MTMPLTIRVKLSRQGNSLRMSVPKPVLDALGWNEGDYLDVGLNDGSMIVKKATE